MDNDHKKYVVLENILQTVNRNYIALPDEEIKRNNKLLQIVDRIIHKMKSKNVLFENLYQNKFYGGSYYDNLKVGKPSEYDLDCVLCLPKIVQPGIEVSDKPGYVHVVLNDMKTLEKKVDEAPKWVGLEKLLDGNRLCTKKVKSWMESLMSRVITKQGIVINIDETEYTVRPKISKSGPALTIKLEGIFNGRSFNIDIDLVPCFTFCDEHWPKKDYRSNPSKKKNTFLVVPKSPNDGDTGYWRLSFQEQERELISGFAVMKPTIRLIKKIRDRHQHKIASYYIKTIFLWELEKTDKDLWSKPLSYVFMIMLDKYREYILKENIPYYWNEHNNLIGELSKETISCIANKLKNIVDDVNRNLSTDPYIILQYLVLQSDIDGVKQEVPLSKKYLKQLQSGNNPTFISPPKEEVELISSASSSSSSSFEEINKDMVEGEISQIILDKIQKLESSCLVLSSNYKRVVGLLETVLEKLDGCEHQIKKLNESFELKKMMEQQERKSLSGTAPLENDVLHTLLPDRLKSVIDFRISEL